jgi:hypothetical protein
MEVMAHRENLVAVIVFTALLAQGMFAATHCFEAIDRSDCTS